MGGSRWDAGAWSGHTAKAAVKTDREIFTSSNLVDALNPAKIKVRESVDSPANPNSTPIILASDVTGSMGALAGIIIRKSLGTIMQEIYDRKPIPDPHMLCGAIGDAIYDRAPLQVTQFEADVKPITEQLAQIFVEGGGGGNGGESYPLIWYFAAYKTLCDAMRKRKRKGYLFTIGDECPIGISADHIKKFLGDGGPQEDVSPEAMLTAVCQNWEVFHLIVTPRADQPVERTWRKLLGPRALMVQDADKMAEVIVSAIQINEGHDTDTVINSWDGSTGIVVRDAVSSLSKGSAGAPSALVEM